MGALAPAISPAFSPRKHDARRTRAVARSAGGASRCDRISESQLDAGRASAERCSNFCARVPRRSFRWTRRREDHFTIMPSELDEITNPAIAYLRLHGRDAHAYKTGKTVAARFNYDYSDEEIEEVAERSRKLAGQAKEVHVVFNNNALDYAPHAALRLRKALKQIAQAPARQAESVRGSMKHGKLAASPQGFAIECGELLWPNFLSSARAGIRRATAGGWAGWRLRICRKCGGRSARGSICASWICRFAMRTRVTECPARWR